MTKPWEEEWEYDQNWPEYVAHSGMNIAKFREGAWDPTPHDEARARLASKAPKMARALLADMVLWEDGQWHDEFRCPALAGGQCADWCAAKRDALREAGVLE